MSHIPDSSSIDDGPQQRVALRSTLSNAGDGPDQPSGTTTVTAVQKRFDHPVPPLSDAEVDDLAAELDELRAAVLESRGASDAAYIRRVIRVQRGLELSSRAVLMASSFRPAWVVGTLGLAVAKVLDNMEIGHNVLHGQWDWMRDPRIQSTTWEWDYATPAELWRRTHNERHHVFTNILGKDNDLGFGILRVDEAQPWQRRHLAQPLLNALNALFFEYGIAAYDAGFGGVVRRESSATPQVRADLALTFKKVRAQATKDFLVWPLLSGPFVPPHPHREPDGLCAAQRVEPLGDHVWTLPRGCGDLRATVHSPRRESWPVVPAPDAGICRRHRPAAPARLGRQPQPPDRAPPLPGPARATGTPRSRPGYVRSSSAEVCSTTPHRCRGRSPRPGTKCCGSRSPTTGWPTPPGETFHAG